MRVKGVYRNQRLELAIPLPLEEGTEVEVDVHTVGDTPKVEDEAWRELGMSRMEEEWDNPEDAVYDDWRSCMAVSAGEVVLVPFPYRDRLGERARPAVVLSARAYNQGGDAVVAAVTSHSPRFATDYALLDWSAAKLQFPSTVRMLLTTTAQTRILHTIGRLSDRDWAAVQVRVLQVFAWP